MKTILIIEDDTVLRENIAELLELSKYHVISASNGKTGIEMAKKSLPDVIVCDIMMPVLDGYDTLKTLVKNETLKHIPFIFLSAKIEHKDIRKGMNLGADDYLTKPFEEDELVSAIESRLAKSAIMQELKLSIESSTDTSNEISNINDLKNFFDDYGVAFSFEKDTVVFRETDHSNYIYLINKGTVKCFQIDAQGKELVTALYKEDDLFGYNSFLNHQPHRETATAIEDVELKGISTNEFNDILSKNHNVALEFTKVLSDDLHAMKSQLIEMAYSSVNRKTAATILKFAEKINRKPEDPIKISRSDLASVAGIATETFIRSLTSFKKQGIIESEGRNIKVIDLEKLKQIF